MPRLSIETSACIYNVAPWVNHSVADRLAFATAQAADKIPQIKKFKAIIHVYVLKCKAEQMKALKAVTYFQRKKVSCRERDSNPQSPAYMASTH